MPVLEFGECIKQSFCHQAAQNGFRNRLRSAPCSAKACQVPDFSPWQILAELCEYSEKPRSHRITDDKVVEQK